MNKRPSPFPHTGLIASLLILCALLPRVMCAQTSVHIAILGDSNTWLGGDECDQPKGWNYWFCKQLKPTTCHSYARSGATWTPTTATRRDVQEYTEKLGDNNVIYNQVCRLQEAVEEGRQPLPRLIIIAAGTNDAWFTQRRPHVFDIPAAEAQSLPLQNLTNRQPNEVLTLAEAVTYNCQLLQQLFPQAHLLLLTPMQSTAVPTDNIVRASDIIEACARPLQAAIVRMERESCVCREREQKQHRYTYDGTHTSEEGAHKNGDLIAQRVIQLLCQKPNEPNESNGLLNEPNGLLNEPNGLPNEPNGVAPLSSQQKD